MMIARRMNDRYTMKKEVLLHVLRLLISVFFLNSYNTFVLVNSPTNKTPTPAAVDR